jgi:hypothetical protein
MPILSISWIQIATPQRLPLAIQCLAAQLMVECERKPEPFQGRTAAAFRLFRCLSNGFEVLPIRP